jgi:tetratricopeptide (TPR) repeat protein
MIDTSTAKQLLQSSDVTLLKSSLKEHRDYLINEGHSIDGMMQLQLIKLLILLYNRLLQVHMADPTTTQAELATTYAGIAYSWNLMSDGEKCDGQLKKALGCDPNCIEALMVQSEVHSNQARFDRAIADLEKVVSILKERNDRPKNSLIEVYLKVSAVHEMKGSFDDAIDVLKVAIIDFNKVESEDTTQTQLIKIELYGRLGTIQDKLALYNDAVDSLSIAVDELKKCYGDKHAKTQELEYILDMANTAKKG